MLNSNELQELYEGLKLNNVNKYDYVLTGKCPGELGAGPVGLDPVGLGLGEGPPRPWAPPWPLPPSRTDGLCRRELGGALMTAVPQSRGLGCPGPMVLSQMKRVGLLGPV